MPLWDLQFPKATVKKIILVLNIIIHRTCSNQRLQTRVCLSLKKLHSTTHLSNQAAIRHTSSNNWEKRIYIFFTIHLFTLSDILKEVLLINLIDSCWLFLVVFPTFTVHSFAAGIQDIFSPERMGCSLCPTLIHTHTHTHSHSPAPTPETPNSTVSPSTTRWPQPDAHFNQLLHQRYNPRWNLIPLFFWSLRTRRSEDGWWQGGSYGQRPLRPIWDSAPTVYRIERTEP